LTRRGASPSQRKPTADLRDGGAAARRRGAAHVEGDVDGEAAADVERVVGDGGGDAHTAARDERVERVGGGRVEVPHGPRPGIHFHGPHEPVVSPPKLDWLARGDGPGGEASGVGHGRAEEGAGVGAGVGVVEELGRAGGAEAAGELALACAASADGDKAIGLGVGYGMATRLPPTGWQGMRAEYFMA
jgi:hypothetical protein